MISSSSVKSALSSVSDIFSSYKNYTNELTDDIWQGKSKENTVSQMENFLSQFSSPIETQLEEFSNAVEKYDEYIEKKEKKEKAESNLSTAESNLKSLNAKTEKTDSDNRQISNYNSSITSYKNEISALNTEMDELKKDIEELITSIKDAKLDIEATALEVEDVTLGDFVNYYQYDYTEEYGYGESIAGNACGPTSMAMVATYLTGETHDPLETSAWAHNNGYHARGNGTYRSYFAAAAELYGLECEDLQTTTNNIVNELQEGNVLILHMNPGHFTSGGHYMVLEGITDDGEIVVADPASRERSSVTWDASLIASESDQMWSFNNENYELPTI